MRAHGNRALLVACAAWVALSVACGSSLAPVLNVDNAPVIAPGGVPPTRPWVRDAIVRALTSRRWTIEQETPAGISASYHWGTNSATVYVQYDERTFSIHHVESTPGLHFNGTAIHRKYNQWVDRLRSTIRGQLTMAAMRAEPMVVEVPPPTAAVPAAPPVAPAPASTVVPVTTPAVTAPPPAAATPAAAPSRATAPNSGARPVSGARGTYTDAPPPPPPPPPAANAPRK